jgi:formylglycine-generating enzyme required for sulfatase activity
LYDDWHIATLAPFTLGQIRYFVDAWYEELGVSATIDSNQLSNLKEMLIKDIVRLPRLRDMAKTPLLLLMMVLVLYNKGKLPRELPKLYESILELLLGQWDCVRDGQTLADVLDLPDWTSERIRPVLDRLSYEAHRDATSTSIRGRIPRMTVEWELREHLIATGMLDDEAAKAAVRAVRYIEQRSGLLQPSAVDYEFAHLTLQEHCSGRHIVRQSNPLSFIMEHRVDDRWREPIFLGLGTIQESNPWLIESVMRRLIERETDRSIDQWYRDLIMAAEIGNDRDWAYLKEQGLDILALQRNLRLGLVTILEDKEHKVSTNERVRAGYLLCDLGDPRFPITQEQWKQEVEKALMGHTDGYFCRVEAGTYFIGGNENDAGVEDDEKPQHTITFYQPFWIARFPITNAQWQAWKTTSIKKAHRTYPDEMKRANHPIANVQWYWCYEFCMWLSKQIGMNIRMPSEAEWEAAARGNDVRLYPWGHEWRDDYSATAEDKERRGLPYSTPVGCYPAGAAPCGAMDMAGNMWEWTQSPYTKNHNPAQTTQLAANAKRFALKGGHHNESAIYARCSARNWSYPDSYGPNSFRVLLSLDPMKLT